MSDFASTPATTARTWGEFLPTPARLRIVIIAALLTFVYWNTIRYSMVEKWIVDGDWSHGWLIPAFSLYFLASRRDQLFAARVQPNWWGGLILVLSLAVYFLAPFVFNSAYPPALSMVGALFGVTLLLCGWAVMRIAWFPILFLVLAVPIPDSVYVRLTMPQQIFASKAAATIMPWFAPGLYTEAQAVVIDYMIPGKPPGRLNVEEACSGMRMMMAFVTLGVAMAYLGERPWWQRLIMIASCVPIAVLCNTIRVTTTGLLFVHDKPEWGKGTPHQLLGIAMLAIALGLYALVGYVLSHLFIEEPAADAA